MSLGKVLQIKITGTLCCVCVCGHLKLPFRPRIKLLSHLPVYNYQMKDVLFYFHLLLLLLLFQVVYMKSLSWLALFVGKATHAVGQAMDTPEFGFVVEPRCMLEKHCTVSALL